MKHVSVRKNFKLQHAQIFTYWCAWRLQSKSKTRLRSIEHVHRFDSTFAPMLVEATLLTKCKKILPNPPAVSQSHCWSLAFLTLIGIPDRNREQTLCSQARSTTNFVQKSIITLRQVFEHSVSGKLSPRLNGQNQLHHNIRLEFVNWSKSRFLEKKHKDIGHFRKKTS